LPVLHELAPFLLPGQSSAVFQSGTLRGRLSGGVFRIEELSFARTALQFSVTGTVTLQGRLNLDVTANTGNIGGRLIHLRVTGTVRNPIVTIEPLTF
jgi:hypothetical protein